MWVYAATHGDVVDETTPFDLDTDRHLYVSEKIAAEMFCRDYANLFGRPYTVLRYGIPFGPRMRSDLVVAAFLVRAMRGEPLRIDGDGSQERRFVYVEDLAAAHVLALEARGARTARTTSSPTRRSRSASSPRRCATSSATSRSRSGRPGPATTARRVVQQRPRARRARVGTRSTRSPRAAQDARVVSTSSKPASVRDATPDGDRRAGIAVVPAYNEEPTVAAVLDELYPLVDELVVVDDGSTDGTRAEIERGWPRPRRAAACSCTT